MYEIEKNIPIPDNRGCLTETLKKLDFGDSFLIEKNKIYSVRTISAKIKIRILVRKENDKFRVWKVKSC